VPHTCPPPQPHNVSISLIGASLLWVGWFGFNAGSAFGANALAGMAMVTTQVATGAAGMSWMFTEWFVKGKPTLMSVISGAVAGLVAITPAAGFVDCNGAIIMGFVVGIVCSQSIRLKHYFGYDDALDAFGVHGVGGAMGSMLTGLFAQPKNNNFYPPGACPYGNKDTNGVCDDPNGGIVSGAFYDHTLPFGHRNGKQLGLQLYGIVVQAGWAAFSSFILLKVRPRPLGWMQSRDSPPPLPSR
jgi:ammonium transporter, Amt family